MLNFGQRPGMKDLILADVAPLEPNKGIRNRNNVNTLWRNTVTKRAADIKFMRSGKRNMNLRFTGRQSPREWLL